MKLKKLKSFLKESSTFNSISFDGNYDMGLNTFFILFEHYLSTGENLLDDYSNVVYLDWDNSELCLDYEKYISLTVSLGRIIRKGLYRDKRIELNQKIREGFENFNRLQNSEVDKRRRKACSFTSRKDVRKSVFDKHGEICLKCGSVENISLDHIVPVSKGGEDEIDNLQPLCKSCNSWKSDKHIDYR